MKFHVVEVSASNGTNYYQEPHASLSIHYLKEFSCPKKAKVWMDNTSYSDNSEGEVLHFIEIELT